MRLKSLTLNIRLFFLGVDPSVLPTIYKIVLSTSKQYLGLTPISGSYAAINNFLLALSKAVFVVLCDAQEYSLK